MKTFLVQSLPLNEVIQNLAREMGTDYEENCDQFILNIPDTYGEGVITAIDFDSGMGIIQYDCRFNEDVEIKFVVNKIHPLKFLFCLEGSLVHRFQEQEDDHLINQYQNVIVASSNLHGHILKFSKNVATKLNSLELDRNEFQKKTLCELKSLEPQTQDLFKDVEAKKVFYYEGFYSLELSDVFDKMRNFEQDYFLKKIYLEGKSYLILSKQLIQYQDDLMDFSQRSVLRRSEIKQIRSSAEKIKNDLASLNSIKDLAQEFGLNANKLQTGYQFLYGMSVNQFIQKQRLVQARNLLENSDKSMSQITDSIGLNSRSYFSKIFKEEFGISPSQIRRKNLKDS